MPKISLIEFAKRLKSFKPEKEAHKIIMSNSEMAVRLNQNQLLDGEMPDDSEILPDYLSESYAVFKNRKNPRPTFGTPDLNLTGKNYNSIRLVHIKGLVYSLENIDPKSKLLISKYGDYMGLQKLNLRTFQRKNDKDLISAWKSHVFK